MKTEVHRQIHHDAHGKRMVTVEERNVCLHAWMHIASVGEYTFCRYLNYMKNNRETRDHGTWDCLSLENILNKRRLC